MGTARGVLAILTVWMLALAPAAHAQTPPSAPAPTPTTPAPPTATPAPPTAVPLIQTPPAVPPPTATPGPAPATTPTPSTSTAPVLERVLGHALSVEEAVSIALETQPAIQQRLADYQAAAFRVDEALSPLLPQLTSLVQASKSQNVAGRSTVTTTNPDRTFTNFQSRSLRTFGETSPLATVTLSQKIFDFGKTFATTEAARRLAEIAQEDVELQRQAVTFLVKQNFILINFAQRLIRVQEQSLERADLNLRSAKGFFEVGTRPKSDVARAEVDVANARVDLIRARNAERVARVALNTAMGIPADTPTQVQDILFYQQVQLDPKQLRAQALAQRPEYKQVRLRVTQAEAQLRRANRDFLPDITGHGTYGGGRSELSEVWEVGVALSWTIFDGGNMIAQVREKRSLVESARAQVRVTELNIGQEVEQAYLVVNEAQERIAASQTAVASAQENFRLAQGRFDAGVGTILELTDAQLFLTQAQNTEAQALADYRVALASLERATGRR
jgi:outer membrane protein